jgi:hypothetical protein
MLLKLLVATVYKRLSLKDDGSWLLARRAAADTADGGCVSLYQLFALRTLQGEAKPRL